jgi:hypothetical protein
MNDDIIYNIYEGSKYKSFPHIRSLVKQAHPDIPDKDIRRVYIEMRVKDSYPTRKKIQPYMRRIYSKVTNSWFHDLMENHRGNPRYYHVFINMNTRYGVAISLDGKDIDSIIESLDKFYTQFPNIYRLASDEESAFTSERVLNYLRNRNTIAQLMPSKVHSAMGMLNRFIRTLRDMHGKMKDDMEEPPSDNITVQEMEKLIDEYNGNYHESIGMAPRDMTPELETKYILKISKIVEKQDKVPL